MMKLKFLYDFAPCMSNNTCLNIKNVTPFFFLFRAFKIFFFEIQHKIQILGIKNYNFGKQIAP